MLLMMMSVMKLEEIVDYDGEVMTMIIIIINHNHVDNDDDDDGCYLLEYN